MDFKLFLENLIEAELDVFYAFFEQLCHYQSNHYGLYNCKALYNAYHILPNDFKLKTTPTKTKLSKCFRGDDGKNNKPVLSFTYNREDRIAKINASYYGRYVFSINELKYFENAMDISLMEKYFGKKQWYKITNDYPIADDENEILIFGGHF